jgi:hypothetical protein
VSKCVTACVDGCKGDKHMRLMENNDVAQIARVLQGILSTRCTAERCQQQQNTASASAILLQQNTPWLWSGRLLSYCEVALLGFRCLGWRWGTQCSLLCVMCSHLCVFPVSPQEILLPPRFRALSHHGCARTPQLNSNNDASNHTNCSLDNIPTQQPTSLTEVTCKTDAGAYIYS